MRTSRGIQLAALLLLSGCRFAGVPQPEPWASALAHDPLLTRARDASPLPYRLGVLPLRLDYDPRTLFADDPARNASAPDVAAFREELVAGLGAISIFDRVEARGQESASAEELGVAAWNANDDLVLECALRSYHQEYLGHTSYLTWFLVYATYVWPAWFVPVDSYGGGLEMHVVLRNVQAQGQPLLEATYTIKPGEVAQEFTPNDRELAGFLDIGALWNVETSLEDSNWRAIERGVGPFVRREFLRRLTQDIEAQVAHKLRSGEPAVRERLLRRVRKRFGLVVGVSDYADPVIGSSPHASKDAVAVADLFSSGAGGSLVAGRDLTVLKDEQATKSAILASIASIASRAAPTDEVVLYFSGFGSSLPRAPLEEPSAQPALGGMAGLRRDLGDRGLFLPVDTRSTHLEESALSLQELGEALGALPTTRVVVFMDASFAGQGPRTYQVDGPGRGPLRVGLVQELMLIEGRVAWLSASPGQAAYDLNDAESGLFTHVLLAGLGGEADADEDGSVTLMELADYVGEQVPSRAGLEGVEQRPLFVGDAGAPLAWPR